MLWDQISDVILFAALAVLAVFGLLGIYQWISRKSFQKIDRPIRFFLVPLMLLVAVYLIFDHFLVLNTRPNGSGEPSFPSTHVMVTATIFFCAALTLPRYVQNQAARIVIYLFMFALLVLIAAGRILSDMHWPLDVAGGFIFAAVFAEIYYLCLGSDEESTHA